MESTAALAAHNDDYDEEVSGVVAGGSCLDKKEDTAIARSFNIRHHHVIEKASASHAHSQRAAQQKELKKSSCMLIILALYVALPLLQQMVTELRDFQPRVQEHQTMKHGSPTASACQIVQALFPEHFANSLDEHVGNGDADSLSSVSRLKVSMSANSRRLAIAASLDWNMTLVFIDNHGLSSQTTFPVRLNMTGTTVARMAASGDEEYIVVEAAGLETILLSAISNYSKVSSFPSIVCATDYSEDQAANHIAAGIAINADGSHIAIGFAANANAADVSTAERFLRERAALTVAIVGRVHIHLSPDMKWGFYRASNIRLGSGKAMSAAGGLVARADRKPANDNDTSTMSDLVLAVIRKVDDDNGDGPWDNVAKSAIMP